MGSGLRYLVLFEQSKRCLIGNVEIIIQFVYVRLYYSPEADYCLLLSRMGMDCNLKSWPTFSSSHSELIEFLALNLP